MKKITKKILSISIFIMLSLFINTTVFAASTTDAAYAGTCIDLDLLNILSYIRILIDLIKVFGPIIVVIMSMVDIIKAIMANNQEGIQKNMHRIPNRLLLIALLFLLPTLFEFVINNVDSKNQALSCLAAADPVKIQTAYQNIALVNVQQAESSIDSNDVGIAANSVNYVTDQNLKSQLESRINIVRQEIIENNKIEIPELSTVIQKANGTVTSVINNASASPTSSKYDNAITIVAKKFLGARYLYGAKTLKLTSTGYTGETDCSFFTSTVYNTLGFNVGYATANTQASWGKVVTNIASAKPGDLIISNKHADGTWHHAMIYLGGDQVIEANGDESCNDARYSKGQCQVKISSFSSLIKYFNGSYMVRRIAEY